MHLSLRSWAMAAAVLGGSSAIAQEVESAKSPLRVLFVGHDPEAPQFMFADGNDPRVQELYRERTASFEALLRERFESVRIVYGEAYTAALSEEADVTVFDARPTVLKPAVREPDPITGEMNYEPAQYVPDDFAHAALTIAAMSPRIGEPLGLKLDWL